MKKREKLTGSIEQIRFFPQFMIIFLRPSYVYPLLENLSTLGNEQHICRSASCEFICPVLSEKTFKRSFY